MVMFLALHPRESISLTRSFARASSHVDDSLRNFLNKVIVIINFTKSFQNFIDDTVIWYLNSKLDLNLS